MDHHSEDSQLFGQAASAASVQGRARETRQRPAPCIIENGLVLSPSLALIKYRIYAPSIQGNSSRRNSSSRGPGSLRTLILALVMAILILACSIQGVPAVSGNPVSDARTWLISNQQSNGSYGAFSEPQTAPAMYALWIGSPSSINVVLGLSFLKNQLQNSTSWFWGGGGNIAEADVPGEILYIFAATHNLGMLNRLSFVSANLTKFQQPNGGFLGYFDTSTNKQVTSSVDTAMALWGLIGANSISSTNEQSAINYLLTLQNGDGSFNLTKTVRSNSLYSLGPEPISITALVLLVLHDASFAASDPHVSAALNYLSGASSTNFWGHVYAASLAALVFTVFSESTIANQAFSYIVSQQNSDGGFRDTARSSSGSEALDTGWAAVALQLVGSCCPGPVSGGGGSSHVRYL